MKVLMVTYSLTSGGAERLIVDLSNELSKNIEVQVLSVLDDSIEGNNFYKPLLSPKIKYHCAKQKLGFSIKKVRIVNRMIHEIEPDIVHFHGAGIIIFFLSSIFFYKKVKYVETLHTQAEHAYKPNLLTYIKKFVYKQRLVKMITISQQNKFSLEKTLGVYNSQLILNGRIEPKQSTKFNQVKVEIENLKVKPDDFVFVHIGRCSKPKNQLMLMEAFKFLKNQNYILLVFGAYFDSPLGIEIKKNSNSKIFFMGEKLNVTDYLLYSDAFCLCSIYEGMPISLIEAFACSSIPICTPTSGANDVIVNGVNGYLSKGFSCVDYVDVLNDFIKNNQLINRSILNETFNKYFSIEHCKNLHLNLYKNVLNE